MDFQEYQNNLEKRRKDALRKQDAHAYVAMCAEVGTRLSDIEDLHLHEQGLAEVARLVKQRHESMDTDEQRRFQNFIKQAEGLRVYDFARNYHKKRIVLESSFPGRFGKNGKQSLRDKNSVDIGACFKNLYEYALHKCTQN